MAGKAPYMKEDLAAHGAWQIKEVRRIQNARMYSGMWQYMHLSAHSMIFKNTERLIRMFSLSYI